MEYKYHIETYTMPTCGRMWMMTNMLPPTSDEEKAYSLWKSMVTDVWRVHPNARVERRLKRRTAKKAFSDYESAICSVELLLTNEKYRITMYVTK